MIEVKNKGGRPRKHPEGPRSTFTFRLPLALRVRLVEAAEAKGRSLSEEIEHIINDHYAGLDTRTIIREEIRTALADADEAKRQRLLAGFSGSNSGTTLNSLQQLYVNAAQNGKQ